MPNRKPLSITSPNHAVALANYFFLGLSGVLLVIGSNANAMSRAMGEAIADIWGVTLAMSAFFAFFSALAARKARRPEYNLKMEMYACVGLTLNLAFFMVCIGVRFGVAGLTTLMFALAFGVGFAWRVFQIIQEQRLIKKARANPHESDPVMADPRNEPDPE